LTFYIFCGIIGATVREGSTLSKKRLTPAVKEETVSDVFRYLVSRSGQSVVQIAEATGIPLNTLYSLHIRDSRKADMKVLKTLANYFGEGVEIFCGTADYAAKQRISPDQMMLLNEYETLTDDAKNQVLGTIMRLKMNPENVARLIP